MKQFEKGCRGNLDRQMETLLCSYKESIRCRLSFKTTSWQFNSIAKRPELSPSTHMISYNPSLIWTSLVHRKESRKHLVSAEFSNSRSSSLASAQTTPARSFVSRKWVAVKSCWRATGDLRIVWTVADDSGRLGPPSQKGKLLVFLLTPPMRGCH